MKKFNIMLEKLFVTFFFFFVPHLYDKPKQFVNFKVDKDEGFLQESCCVRALHKAVHLQPVTLVTSSMLHQRHEEKKYINVFNLWMLNICILHRKEHLWYWTLVIFGFLDVTVPSRSEMKSLHECYRLNLTFNAVQEDIFHHTFWTSCWNVFTDSN